jgi:hypothetical protein
LCKDAKIFDKFSTFSEKICGYERMNGVKGMNWRICSWVVKNLRIIEWVTGYAG